MKNPLKRLGCGPDNPLEIMRHEWFAGVDWDALLARRIDPPFKPQIPGQNNVADLRYVPAVFKQQDIADSPVGASVLGTSGPGRHTMHFEDFSYMGSDIMGSRRTSLFRESDFRMDIGNFFSIYSCFFLFSPKNYRVDDDHVHYDESRPLWR